MGPRFTLPRRVRLRRSADFRRVQGSSHKLRQPSLLVLWAAGRGEQARVGLTVSRKVGNAVVRNRVKRWLREAVRHERHRLRARVDVVLIAHPDAASAGAAALRQQVSAAFQGVGRGRR